MDYLKFAADNARAEFGHERITVGTKIYYTGDMANPDGWFTVVMLREPWCYDLAEDGGENREILGIHQHQIGHAYFGHCDPRFVTETAYRAYRGETQP